MQVSNKTLIVTSIILFIVFGAIGQLLIHSRVLFYLQLFAMIGLGIGVFRSTIKQKKSIRLLLSIICPIGLFILWVVVVALVALVWCLHTPSCSSHLLDNITF